MKVMPYNVPKITKQIMLSDINQIPQAKSPPRAEKLKIGPKKSCVKKPISMLKPQKTSDFSVL